MSFVRHRGDGKLVVAGLKAPYEPAPTELAKHFLLDALLDIWLLGDEDEHGATCSTGALQPRAATAERLSAALDATEAKQGALAARLENTQATLT